MPIARPRKLRLRTSAIAMPSDVEMMTDKVENATERVNANQNWFVDSTFT